VFACSVRGSEGRMGKRPFIGKNYRTCTFKGLGSRKDDFLEKMVHEMEAKGFRKSAPIEPFKPSLGLKDAISKSSAEYLEELIRYNMAGPMPCLYPMKMRKWHYKLKCEVMI
jgi:hypothetical protein